jgi:DNA-3-methyladenine glycosylase I
MPRPYQHDLETDAGLLGLLTRKIFHAGFGRSPVDKRWPAFEQAFAGFDPVEVAGMTLDVLAADATLVRNRLKLKATINNARHFVAVAQTHGSWRAWLSSLRRLTYEERADTLRACLSFVGDSTVFYFLLEAGEADLSDRPEHVQARP